MIVDSYIHAWKWPDHFSANASPGRRSPTAMDLPVESYLKEAEGTVDKAIIIGMKVASFGTNIPNDYVAECVRKHPDKLAGVCCVDPNEEGAVAEIERCVTGLGLIGLNLLPTYQHFYPHDEKYFPIYEKAQQLDIPVLFHAGLSHFRGTRLIFGDVRFIDEVAVKFPELKIVIPHMGLGAYQDVVDMMEKNDNMFADISYLAHWAGVEKRHIRRDLPATEFPYFRWLRPILYASSSVLTADKLLFGSDWPMVNPRIGVEALRNITTMLKEYGLPLIPRATIENILGRNWRQVYRL